VFIFDTDAITHDQNAHPVLRAKVNSTPQAQLFTTSVTVEEQLRGRLAYINKYRQAPAKAAQGHVALIQTIYYFSTWNILAFSEAADTIFRQLRTQRIRIGGQDLRIAAIALLYSFTVVTGNIRDFSQVPGLNVVDWTTVSQ
jgi:tRNA(fMet)-specific endonuclease VapC